MVHKLMASKLPSAVIISQQNSCLTTTNTYEFSFHSEELLQSARRPKQTSQLLIWTEWMQTNSLVNNVFHAKEMFYCAIKFLFSFHCCSNPLKIIDQLFQQYLLKRLMVCKSIKIFVCIHIYISHQPFSQGHSTSARLYEAFVCSD